MTNLLDSQGGKDKAEGFKKEEPFRVVVLGTAAGGRVALDDFFRQPVPKDTSYIIAAHLYEDELDALSNSLRSISSMQVTIAKEKISFEPNRIYILASNGGWRVAGDFWVVSPDEDEITHPIDGLMQQVSAFLE
ncbi:chemotaxis protein CheB [Niabella hibiscisoli]|uniref:chemotaxis protein CheB n=1 Tax=Niabella hibiscisoli TaxID=1825928 RepID=UPI0021D4194B|nr:chemotaxis protein CheB [Niabella hibiscisoli]